MTNKKIEKSAFILIIILLVIFVPISSFAVYFHLNSAPKSSTNNNHDYFMTTNSGFMMQEAIYLVPMLVKRLTVGMPVILLMTQVMLLITINKITTIMYHYLALMFF